MVKIEEATEIEQSKYFCSGRKCKNDPVKVVTYDILRAGRKVIQKKYLCLSHVKKYLPIDKPKEELHEEEEKEGLLARTLRFLRLA